MYVYVIVCVHPHAYIIICMCLMGPCLEPIHATSTKQYYTHKHINIHAHGNIKGNLAPNTGTMLI